MSSPTPPISTATASATMGTSDSSTSAPLEQVLPYLISGLSLIIYLLKSLGRLLQTFLYPLPAILYLLAPVTVFLTYLVFVFVLAPYRIVAYLLEALHPVYVFCGVACITGGLLGVTGRFLSSFLVSSLAVPQLVVKAEVGGESKPTRVKFES